MGKTKFAKNDEIRRKTPVFQGLQMHFGQDFVCTGIVPDLNSAYLNCSKG